jgi:membrane fusion protein (multidrug efflux system)
MTTTRRLTGLFVIALTFASGCKRDDASAAVSTDPTMSVGPEQIAIVKAQEIRTGPTISGSLEAETQATARAEIPGTVLQTLIDVGQQVRTGQELARLDDAAIRDAFLSARSGVTIAENTVQMAQREVQRAEVLSKAGAIPERQLEQARNQLIGAQAQSADAHARLTAAQKQLEKTVVRAPWEGVVSVRSVTAGDFVSPGSPMFTIIKPSTMRLEASVPAEALSAVRIGAPVEFTINGYPNRRFTGRISSINPAADPATRQVRVIVTLPNQSGTLVAGLFAEGRVASESRVSPVVPAQAVDESGVRPWVMRLKSGKAERVEVELGIRDATTETVEIRSGVTPGDTILMGTARGLTPGSPVKVSTPTDTKTQGR